MERESVVCMSRVAGLLARIKGKVAEHLGPESLEAYKEIRDLIGDCQEILAVHCDTAPIRLISGRVEEIMDNMGCSEKLALKGESTTQPLKGLGL